MEFIVEVKVEDWGILYELGFVVKMLIILFV